KLALYDLNTDSVKFFDIEARSAVFHPDGRIFFIENKDSPRTIFSMDPNGGRRKKEFKRPRLRWFSGKFSPFRQLWGFTLPGRYLLYQCGTMVLPGVRVATIEVLDLESGKMTILRDRAPLSGASWQYS